jgi:hypothetical protein
MPREADACGFSPQERSRRPNFVLYRITESTMNRIMQKYVVR